jgi:DNA polymerase-3 subunit delta'
MSDEVVQLPWPWHPYAWQQTQWQHLNDQIATQRLPHGLLVSGAAGIGKERLVKALVARLLCMEGGVTACGRCKACHLLETGVHPDLLWLTLETNPTTKKLRTVITVEQVRGMVEFTNKMAQLGGWRVVVVSPAELLNTSSANAMLKTLEEPGERTLIVLLTSQPMSLMPTIRSRCQTLALKTPPFTEALAWLMMEERDESRATLLLSITNGAPLAAQALRDAPWFTERSQLVKDLLALLERKKQALEVAKSWHGLGGKELFEALESLSADIVVLASGATVVKHRDIEPIMAKLAAAVPVASVLRWRQSLAEKQRQLAGNVNASALIDALFTEWVVAARG